MVKMINLEKQSVNKTQRQQSGKLLLAFAKCNSKLSTTYKLTI